mgnify:FL=1
MFNLNEYKIILIPILASLICQLIKIILIILKKKKINLKQAMWAVGMPSSHSAFFTSLLITIGIVEGINSAVFAVALLFSLAYVYDMILVFNVINDNIKELKNQLGHSSLEVIVGIIIGIIIALILN